MRSTTGFVDAAGGLLGATAVAVAAALRCAVRGLWQRCRRPVDLYDADDLTVCNAIARLPAARRRNTLER